MALILHISICIITVVNVESIGRSVDLSRIFNSIGRHKTSCKLVHAIYQLFVAFDQCNAAAAPLHKARDPLWVHDQRHDLLHCPLLTTAATVAVGQDTISWTGQYTAYDPLVGGK